MAEADFVQTGDSLDWTPAVALAAGEVIQIPDGRAAVAVDAIAAGQLGAVKVDGIRKIAKTANITLLRGGRVYWDHSANTATYKKVNDRDFYIGRVAEDAAATASVVKVALNIDPAYDIDLQKHPFLSVPTGTQAVGGFGYPKRLGGANVIELTATSEVQCIDLLSVDKFAVASNPILEAIFRPVVNGSGAAVDFNLGFANGTSTSDADAVTEHCYIHIDGSDTKIYAQSKDGSTTVAATDTTTTITAGSAVANKVEVWMDARDPADIQIYINGVLVLPSSVFNLGAAVGPLGLLAHLEKSTGTTTGNFAIDELRVRLMQD